MPYKSEINVKVEMSKHDLPAQALSHKRTASCKLSS